MQLIETSQQLYDFCEYIRQNLALSENFITVDTEFQRERTYYPKLCLVQIATHDRVAIIDALAPELDLSPLWQIMSAPEIIKVFHAARQDIEIFYLLSQQIPTPIFDTQIAAMVCGFGDSIGYDALVQYYVHQTVDKSFQRTDWQHRPLSDQQLQYAANDVIYLRKIYQSIQIYLHKHQRHEWFQEELDVLHKPETYITDEDQVWRRLKLKNHQGEFLVRLQALAKLREQWARQSNRPRGHVLIDDIIVDLATAQPNSIDNIPNHLRQKLKTLSVSQVQTMIDVMNQAAQSPRELWPRLPRHRPHNETAQQLIGLLEFFLNLRAEQLHIVPRLLATRDELALLAHKKEAASIRLLSNWRYQVYGADALALINGQAVLKIDGKKVIVTAITG